MPASFVADYEYRIFKATVDGENWFLFDESDFIWAYDSPADYTALEEAAERFGFIAITVEDKSVKTYWRCR